MNEIETHLLASTTTTAPPLLSLSQDMATNPTTTSEKNETQFLSSTASDASSSNDTTLLSASPFVQPNVQSLTDDNTTITNKQDSLLSTSYKLFNKNFTTLMKYTANASNLIDINMAMRAPTPPPHTILNDTITEGQVQLNFSDKKKLNDLLAAATLDQQQPCTTKSSSAKSKSTYSSSSSTSSNSSSCSSTSTSSSQHENILAKKPTLLLPSTTSTLNAASTPQKASKPALKHHSSFNIENELIKYTKTLKLSATQSFLSAYKLGAHIRNGGFSEIYEGDLVHSPPPPHAQPVIVKMIPKHKTKNWLMVHSKKYPAEILLHKMCNSVPGVVKMIEFYEQEHEWIIIMPKLTNCMDLFDYLESKQRGRLSEHEACHFFVQLVRINMDLLNQGVVHRDIKSENLLVDMDTMNLVLIDFGASAIHRHTADSTTQVHFYTDFHGTKQYKPPEYIKYKKYTAQASTIWALGILLYDMCNGQLPFETEQEILEYNLQIKANMSDEYKKILFDCLKPDPVQRPSLGQLLEYPWCVKHGGKESSASNQSLLSSALVAKNVLASSEATSSKTSMNKSKF